MVCLFHGGAQCSRILASMVKHLQRHKYEYALLVLFAAIIGLNAYWLSCSRFSLRNDSAIHAYIVAEMGNPWVEQYPYPRLVHYLTFALTSWLGNNQWPYFIVQSLFSGIFVAATFLLGSRIFNKSTGFLAALFLVCSSSTMVSLRTFFMDYPLAAVFSVQLLLYAYSQRLTRLWPSLAFYALILIAPSIRAHYFIYSVPLFAGILWDIAANSEAQARAKNWRSFGLHLALMLVACTLACLMYCLLWDVGSLQTKMREINFGGITGGQVMSRGASGAWVAKSEFAGSGYLAALAICKPGLATLKVCSRFFAAYLVELQARQLLPLLFWAYAIGACWAMAIPKYRRCLSVYWWPLIASSAILVLLTTNNFRYYAPLLGIQCIIAAFWLAKVRAVRVSAALVFGVWGLVLSGGWISQVIPLASSGYLQNELVNTNILGNFYDVSFVLHRRHRVRVQFGSAGMPRNLLGFKTVWSDSCLFSVDTYKVDWVKLAKDMASQVDGKATIGVTVRRDPNSRGQNGSSAGLDLTNDYEMATMLNYVDTRLPEEGTEVHYCVGQNTRRHFTHVVEFYPISSDSVSEVMKEEKPGLVQRLSNSFYMRMYRKKHRNSRDSHLGDSDSGVEQ